MIESSAELLKLVRAIDDASWIAMDTEADSLHFYPERLCLIQITLPSGDYLVDPLALEDLSPLWSALLSRELIFHGADFDLRLLHRTEGFVPSSVFDTMVAARLVGAQRFGLSDLVEQYVGVKLDKSLRKANWGRRPLSPEMLEYAQKDTRYLRDVAESLRLELEGLERLFWFRQSCERLISECTKDKVVDEDKVWRIRGSDRLDRRGLQVLRALWYWRDEEALRSNRPPYYVLSHERLVDLAEKLQDVSPSRVELPRRMNRQRKNSLRRSASLAIRQPRKSWPETSPPRDRQPRRQRRADPTPFKQARDKIAKHLSLDPSLIASRAQLERLAYDWDEGARAMMEWQVELLRDFRPTDTNEI